jgi:hypothetical protein
MSLISSQYVNHFAADVVQPLDSLIVNNAITAASVTASGAVSAGSLAVTGAASVSGALTLGALSVGSIQTVSAATATVGATTTAVIGSFAGGMTLTLPAASSLPGRVLIIKNDVAQTVASASSNIIPLIGGAAGTAILTAAAGKFAVLVSNGTNYVIMAAA